MEAIIASNNFEQVVTNLKNLIQTSLEDGKAQDVVTIDLEGKTDIADCMIVASGTSNRHASSLAEKLVEQIKEVDPNYSPAVEGLSEGSWVLVDTGDVIVHIFKPEERNIYNLEKMWSVPLPNSETATTA